MNGIGLAVRGRLRRAAARPLVPTAFRDVDVRSVVVFDALVDGRDAVVDLGAVVG